MENNLILLLLSREEEKRLKNSQNEDIASLASKNYGVVSTEDAYNARMYLSGPSRHRRQIVYTKEQREALEEIGNDYYLYLDGREVGEELYYEVQDYLKELLTSLGDTNTSENKDEEQLEY